MIDCHCHLEQKDYSEDRDEIIEKCKKELKAVITSCAHTRDFDMTIHLSKKYNGFVFSTVGIHPEYIKEISEKQIEEFMEKTKDNRKNIFGIGEIGLDYNWVKESNWQKKQTELFKRMIRVSKELKLPLVIHSRDSMQDTLKILEQEDAKEVMMHMFGSHDMLKIVIDNGWYISLNTIVLKSKKYKKIARDVPMERLMTETDSPWLGIDKKRNDPTSVKIVLDKICEIKNIDFVELDKITTQNAINFFNLSCI